jgi:hypothetical protein
MDARPSKIASVTDSEETEQHSEASIASIDVANRPKAVPIHAPNLAHYSPLPLSTVVKESLLVTREQKSTFQKNGYPEKGADQKTGGPDFRIPVDVAPWAKTLRLEPENIAMLMRVAKKTDPHQTRTRLQDLLEHVGNRMVRAAIFGVSASKYLYKCLATGEDYSKARFEAPDAPQGNRDVSAASSLRANLPSGEVTEVGGLHLVRDGITVRRVDPVLGLSGPVHLLNLEQQAVLARRAGFFGNDSGNDRKPEIDTLAVPTKQVEKANEPAPMVFKDARRKQIRLEFLSISNAEQRPFAHEAFAYLVARKMASKSMEQKVETNAWESAPILFAKMVELYAVACHGSQWGIEPTA